MRAFFTKTFTVYRLAIANAKESYSLVGDIKGYLTPLSAQDAFISEGNPAQQYKLITDLTSDVKKTDKLLYDGNYYLVTGIQKFDFGAMRRIEALCELFNS